MLLLNLLTTSHNILNFIKHFLLHLLVLHQIRHAPYPSGHCCISSTYHKLSTHTHQLFIPQFPSIARELHIKKRIHIRLKLFSILIFNTNLPLYLLSVCFYDRKEHIHLIFTNFQYLAPQPSEHNLGQERCKIQHIEFNEVVKKTMLYPLDIPHGSLIKLLSETYVRK
ncbi:hypothetical protein V8G54_016941 [Vigna mungo]|uniref:Uncharacterized protein n=1 Tax=Vigna mungo TaxID=3915 RepID=A0AAQ3NNZ9_VIGMU